MGRSQFECPDEQMSSERIGIMGLENRIGVKCSEQSTQGSQIQWKE